jgi:bacillolysin
MTTRRILAVLVLVTLVCVAASFAAELRPPTPVAATDFAAATQWSSWLASGARSGQWRLRATQRDADFSGRRHQRYSQTVNDVPVFGAEVVQQLDENGVTRTVFGGLYEGLTVDTQPKLTAEQARHVVEAAVGQTGSVVGQPELVVLPLDNGIFLTDMITASSLSPPSEMRYFVDAHSGAIVFAYQDLKTATPVIGLGTGAWGDHKKVSAQQNGAGTFLAQDRLRPAPITTYDIKFLGQYTGNEVATDSDNNWTDGMVVDAHNYAGVTYDYYYQRHGRHGIDDHDMATGSLVHIWRSGSSACNAFWSDYYLAMLYGDGGNCSGVAFAPFTAGIDVTGHEMTHGVTSRTWNGIYSGESGALNEAFSDIMGTSVEFFAQPVGNGRLMADYWMGEDLTKTFDPRNLALRSMADPGIFGDPDNYSRRYLGASDNGGVHWNSGVANQAFYLLIEGGTNRTSGMTVTGLGAANRAKAEKIFYRGFTHYLTPSATFRDARRVTIQAASDLYGPSSNEVQQVQAAWSAVGVN